MKFAFTCEICERELSRSDKFEIMIMRQEDESYWEGEECADEVCRPCAMKVIKKITSMRKAANRKAA